MQSSQKTAKLFKMRATHQKRKQEEHIPQSIIITSTRSRRVTERSELTGEESTLINDDELTPDIRSHDEGKEKEINCDKLPSNLASLKITVQKV